MKEREPWFSAPWRRLFLADTQPYRALGYSRWQTARVIWRSRRFLLRRCGDVSR